MVKKEILKRLNGGEKIIAIKGGWGNDYYFLGQDTAKNQLTSVQFKLYKKLCKHSDESARNAIRGQAVRHYYWL